MDPATLIGIGIAAGSLMVGMLLEGGNPMALILPPALIIVFGGTFGAAIACGLMNDAKNAIGWVKVAFLAPAPTAGDTVATVVKLAETARREGLLALEEAARSVEDPFLRRGLELAVDGTDSEELRSILEAEITAKENRDRAGAKLFKDMGGFAPTMGIIGTVMGLVHVLENLSNPAELGHMIAGAFVATLWGVLTANVMWLPMANKIARLSQIEVHLMEVVVDGIMAIQAGTNPRVLQQRLTASLEPGDTEETPEKEAA
jgi:chemotaxis protein MotA